MAGTQGGTAPQFCARCGHPLQAGASFCSFCATPVASSSLPQPFYAAPPPPPTKPLGKALWAVIIVVVVVVVVLVILAAVPVAQRSEYQTQIVAPAAGLFGCGTTSIGAIQSFPSGKTIHVSWTTTPAENITLGIVGMEEESGVFSGSGSSGSGTFYSIGDEYDFGVSNCGSQATSVSITAYYNFNAPLL